MKLNFKTIFIALSVSAAAISCSDFGALNSDPTKSTDMDPNLLLPTLQMTLTNDWQEWHRHFMYPGGFVQQWCGDWGTVEYGCCGIKNDSYMAELWLQRYTRMAKGLVDIVERTKDDPAQANINAAGRLMLVYTFAQLTDMYGDIPYSEAGKGYYTGQYKPKYDTQEEIYNDFFRQLEIADAQLRKGTDVIKYDQYYDGDTAKWRKYVNSLRLRLALRLIKVNPDKAKEEARIAIENGVMESNADLCRIKYENFANPSAGPGRGNALSNRFRAEPRNFRFSRKLISYMEQTSDPRIRIYGACYLEDGTDITDLVYEKTRSYTEMARYTDRFDWENYGDDPTVVTPDMTIKTQRTGFHCRAEIPVPPAFPLADGPGCAICQHELCGSGASACRGSIQMGFWRQYSSRAFQQGPQGFRGNDDSLWCSGPVRSGCHKIHTGQPSAQRKRTRTNQHADVGRTCA